MLPNCRKGFCALYKDTVIKFCFKLLKCELNERDELVYAAGPIKSLALWYVIVGVMERP